MNELLSAASAIRQILAFCGRGTIALSYPIGAPGRGPIETMADYQRQQAGQNGVPVFEKGVNGVFTAPPEAKRATVEILTVSHFMVQGMEPLSTSRLQKCRTAQ